MKMRNGLLVVIFAFTLSGCGFVTVSPAACGGCCNNSCGYQAFSYGIGYGVGCGYTSRNWLGDLCNM